MLGNSPTTVIMKDQLRGVRKACKQKAEETARRVDKAIERLVMSGSVINFALVAKEAGVSGIEPRYV